MYGAASDNSNKHFSVGTASGRKKEDNSVWIKRVIVKLFILSNCFEAIRYGPICIFSRNEPIIKWAIYRPQESVVSSTIMKKWFPTVISRIFLRVSMYKLSTPRLHNILCSGILNLQYFCKNDRRFGLFNRIKGIFEVTKSLQKSSLKIACSLLDDPNSKYCFKGS
ncbi:unnamed protein product [Psylliodes chrysocephalus]|uniref:Uncharacterized protein n=1 Tax=Psylliodes chrysocephalus TaxID=3402493 RepID=A0A9P0CYC4_9CUCU|nr:unnamed protein product [Psylliodes chrysocephala]